MRRVATNAVPRTSRLTKLTVGKGSSCPDALWSHWKMSAVKVTDRTRMRRQTSPEGTLSIGASNLWASSSKGDFVGLHLEEREKR